MKRSCCCHDRRRAHHARTRKGRHPSKRPAQGRTLMSVPVQALQGVPNACQLLPTVATGGQPTASHLTAFKTAGGPIGLDLREPTEPRPLDEPTMVGALGLEYVNIPVGPGTLNDGTIERILAVLREAGDRQVFVHCGSGNRVGGALIP